MDKFFMYIKSLVLFYYLLNFPISKTGKKLEFTRKII